MVGSVGWTDFLGIGWTGHKNSRSTCGRITFSGILHYPDQGRSGTGAPLSLPRRKLPYRMPFLAQRTGNASSSRGIVSGVMMPRRTRAESSPTPPDTKSAEGNAPGSWNLRLRFGILFIPYEACSHLAESRLADWAERLGRRNGHHSGVHSSSARLLTDACAVHSPSRLV